MKKFAILFVLGLVSWTGLAQVKMTFVVHEEAKKCRRMMEQMCLQIQKNGSKTWELFYERIEGFEYEPGYRYVIEVIETERPEPIPQDLSRYLYRLEKIVSKTPVLTKQEVSSYQLMRLNGRGVSSHGALLNFDSTMTQLSGKPFCNRISISVKFNAKKSKMWTKAGVSTKMSCGDEKDQIESELLAAINQRKLKIKVRDGLLVFLFKRKEVMALKPTVDKSDEEPRVTVRPEKTPWNYFDLQPLHLIQLDGVTQKNSPVFIQFDVNNKSFSGHDGCNRIMGKMKGSGNSIRFDDIVGTKMACMDELVATNERRIREILATEGLTVDFAENVLNIYDPSGKLVMMLAADAQK